MSEPDVSDLVTVDRAIEIIDATPVSPRTVEMSLVDADGLRLAQDVVADRDYPPFDKSLMDGFAVRCADLVADAKTPVTLAVVGEVAAGARPARGLAGGEALAIMTGAPMPEGADGVVPVEDVERTSADTIRILRSTTPGRYIATHGSDVRGGVTVLRAGTRLGPAQLAVAASVGASRVRVFAKPRAAVLATGDEIVPVDREPGPAQIRNSNSLMLVSLLKRLGCDVADLGVTRDDPDTIRDALRRGIASFDVLFVTGGMSMGEYDYVPKLLAELGVELRVTKLRIKPGKPFVFGVAESSGFRVQGSGSADALAPSSLNPEPRTLNPRFVFGLPGNPVSGYVCTVRLAARLLSRLSGGPPEPRWITAPLTAPLKTNGPREFYQPAVLSDAGVLPLEWKGSADVFTLAAANALLVRPENDPARAPGDAVRVLEVPS
jgi:molybdopterin molybdotransferase